MQSPNQNSTAEKQISMATDLQHAGKDHRVGTGLVSATENAVTFQSASATDLPVYSRLGNTANHREVEAMLARLHHADQSIATGSGMSCLTLILTTMLKPGDHVLVVDVCYGGTYNLLTKVYSRWGIESSFQPMKDWSAHLKPNTRMVIFESITNPFCSPQDIGAAIGFAKKHQLISVCDNTFASPALCKPLLHGADLVFESATKYLNGHSDVIAGMIAGSNEHMNQLRPPHAFLGTFLPPYQCTQLLRGIRTLELRMEAHSKSGQAFADALRQSPLVAEVSHGLEQGHSASKFYKRGFGGMVSVKFSKSIDVKKLMSAMRLVTNVPSLGGTESTATMPSYSTNWFMTDAEKSRYGIDDQLVRFSIGLETAEDLIEDVLTAAKSCQRN